jgi:beta-galactosidase
MDEPTAAAVRQYVANGGTVIMTGYSAKVDETGKWFETSLPGRLSDVFGLRTNAFYRAEQPLKVTFKGQALTGSDPYYEVLELGTAKPLATFENTPQKSPAITVNHFGKGQAIYVATAPQAELLGPLVRSLYPALGIKRGPTTPSGVLAREVDGRTLYVNTTQAPITVPFDGVKTGVMSHKRYAGSVALAPYGVEFVK